jgi:MYXO-CTERM domain-containing protein
MFDAVSAFHEIEGVPRPAAASALLDGKATLLVFPVSAEPVALAALVAAALQAAAGTAPLSELEPLSVPAETLRGWERPPGAASVVATGGASDGRWCWAAGLALLGLETWMRRRRKVLTAAEAVSA